MENFTMEQGGIDVVRKAQVYAQAAHAAVGQKRKYTGEAYKDHPHVTGKVFVKIQGEYRP